jgi:hypothetical protein
VAKPGFFGSDNNTTEIPSGRAQHFKNPHLRNAYQKVGMFGSAFPGSAGFENSADRLRSQLNDYGIGIVIAPCAAMRSRIRREALAAAGAQAGSSMVKPISMPSRSKDSRKAHSEGHGGRLFR